MQQTKFKLLIDSLIIKIATLISDSWSNRSIKLISLLCGFYITNSFISYLLDKSVNTIILGITITILMEVSIRILLLSNRSPFKILILSINNFRIGATYALILEAFKLGS
tara:strand:- start:2897 stop:3226 length:330 start_codon:yes stop_codon:yes gene_type:complete